MSIKQNIQEIQHNIEQACNKCGRDPKDVMLLAVTKTHTAEEINQVVEAGITCLAENRVQELLSKYDDVQGDVQWHLIGHLQKNKVKYIADKVVMIHSVESMSLVEEINKQCGKLGRVMDILVEINISGEESKHGITPRDVHQFVQQAAQFEHVRVRGLMTMAPKYAQTDQIHDIFAQLYKISVDISTKKYDNISMDYLSMGMSNDYEIAVEEGSNIVRIGSALFK
ncbi:MAG: YggS family pyridoxal phosphate-dependent enzyme [Clostridia bacterium]|nr:YggS family pyridoxal phosphate-dependent enzyme [Clostridia bacterium]